MTVIVLFADYGINSGENRMLKYVFILAYSCQNEICLTQRASAIDICERTPYNDEYELDRVCSRVAMVCAWISRLFVNFGAKAETTKTQSKPCVAA